MKTTKILLFILTIVPFLFTACRENIITPEEAILNLNETCPFTGFEIKFADTCSYGFAVNFLNQLDSVEILDITFGGKFYVEADSGDVNYWREYFQNGTTIEYIRGVGGSLEDLLLLEIWVTGETPIGEETSKLSSTRHLNVINFKKDDNIIYLWLPEDKAGERKLYFEQYGFIRSVSGVYACGELRGKY